MTDDKPRYPVITYTANVYSYSELHQGYFTDITHESFTCEQAAHRKYTEYLGNAIRLSYHSTGFTKTLAFNNKLQYLIELQKHCQQSDGLEGYVTIEGYFAEDYKLEAIE